MTKLEGNEADDFEIKRRKDGKKYFILKVQ